MDENFKDYYRIAISGSSGFVGSELTSYLKKAGYQIIPITRSDFENSNELFEKIKSCQVIINLAGSPILTRWSQKNKKKILESRVKTTNIIVKAIKKRCVQPYLFINASAIGIYDCYNKHTETSENTDDNFLSEVVEEWENAAYKAEDYVNRLVLLRLGIVLSKNGGFIKKNNVFFKYGLGMYFADGKQKMSFIHIDDLYRSIEFIFENSALRGVVNAVAPQVTTNLEYAKCFTNMYGWNHLFRMPAWIIKFFAGNSADLLLKGQEVIPDKFNKQGFVFKYPDIKSSILSLKK